MTTVPHLDLCCAASLRAGEDLGGTAPRWDHAFAVALPQRRWDDFRDVTCWSDHRRAVWERLGDFVKTTKIGFGLLAYDAGADLPPYHVTHYRRPGPFAAGFVRHDVQTTEQTFPDFVEAALQDVSSAATSTTAGLDFHVCTHGRVDAACGKFGASFERALHGRFAHARAWRTAHIGGHRFAPTMIELPSGRFWGRLTPGVAEMIARREGDPGVVARHLRGWAGLDAWGQVVDREMFAREGWAWLDTPKRGETLHADERGADVRLAFARLDGALGAVEARVEVTHTVTVPGGSHKPDLVTARQYAVTRLEVRS
ncbi:sucrase ferredoxin [Deinococcus yavapaiensis]|uniref:Sucrase/ferredoxin-like protein n=1 Tax=Deinococcus yavapaiensis KR-236 TaxID=694435 RepID=A0A318SD57_9DEIO|nr:sucrase ferredoxin [Deinococcus yavapaiensis]PYE49967.1 hypothetical protein DES52_12052 [Deinococcus yavapaiensis KR-236]